MFGAKFTTGPVGQTRLISDDSKDSQTPGFSSTFNLADFNFSPQVPSDTSADMPKKNKNSQFSNASQGPEMKKHELNSTEREGRGLKGSVEDGLKDLTNSVSDIKLTVEKPSSKTEGDLLVSARAFINRSVGAASFNGRAQQIRMTPLLTWDGKLAQEKHTGFYTFDQISLLGYKTRDCLPSPAGNSNDPTEEELIEPIFLNTETPWSAFICGSQGSGKSHALSVLLENCLYEDRSIGRLPRPLSAVVFHYDNQSRGSVCEAAYLASLGIPVRVLASETNYATLKAAYGKIPGAKANLTVQEFVLRPEDLNTARLQTLMAFGEKNGHLPLYMTKVNQVLRVMARVHKDGGMLTLLRYQKFKRDLAALDLSDTQRGPLDLRVSLLEDYMKLNPPKNSGGPYLPLFTARPGELTIVDLSTPLLDQAAACSLFNICLELFLEADNGVAKIVGLDEAHKYMGPTDASAVFTNTLLHAVRLQRHAGVRMVISTQEPTVSPKLLDLCSMTFVHRFSSPDWFGVLSGHIAGLAKKPGEEGARDGRDLFQEIVELKVGESYLFAPTAVLDVCDGNAIALGAKGVRIKTRMRLSADGGVSRLAGE
ncbi:hypothetical protein EJ05DRAFT_508831 [Pseudovirgaria hyperparasitica]|uniref:P-loop containing nucleoside triphosphate hydrolase protein n=1 Tax=Pseudovirgaria hyperparasitica TaxID=470096 RepID=A0A6A6WFC0_9PEZI|nr:uncharacterized protein EJ05DRAFT_508831 [Pseudovirgaria hyperparasitica]KAF2760277.1 hypothetical protein EJ05DRAFT_508831 [Pseudovirgaria hyperparasitica]